MVTLWSWSSRLMTVNARAAFEQVKAALRQTARNRTRITVIFVRTLSDYFFFFAAAFLAGALAFFAAGFAVLAFMVFVLLLWTLPVTELVQTLPVMELEVPIRGNQNVVNLVRNKTYRKRKFPLTTIEDSDRYDKTPCFCG